jgi:ATP-dependent DNA helicase DinG
MKFAVLDFETTGNQPQDDIIQIGLVTVENGEISGRFSSFVHLGRPVPKFIQKLTGIDDSMLANAPALEEVISQILPLLENSVLVGHHIQFDLVYLQRALEACGYLPFSGRVLDTVDFLKLLYPGLTSYQLSMVCKVLNIRHERPHQADSDAEATARIWLNCLHKLESTPFITIQRLADLFSPAADDFSWFINEIRLQKEMAPPEENSGVRCFRQFALKVDDWTENEHADAEREEEAGAAITPHFPEFIAELMARVQSEFGKFERREAQEQMIAEVFDSLDGERHLVIEAGTGTGKSLGYLIPALYFAVLNGKKVIVSTHTINLQEQLHKRDIPLLSRVFPATFKAAVLKGRNHYLCLRKFEHKIAAKEFKNDREDRHTAAQMLIWLGETEQGDEEELHLGGRGKDFWKTVASDSDSCLNRACPWFKTCFYHRAKNAAMQADLIITNHSLLLTDVIAEHRLLPSYGHVIIDEAHQFDEAASKHLGCQLSYFSLANALFWLGKDQRAGQLPQLRSLLAGTDAEQAEKWSGKIDELLPGVLSLREQWEQLTDAMYRLLLNRNDSAQLETGQLAVRLKTGEDSAEWRNLKVMAENLLSDLGAFLKELSRLRDELKEAMQDFELQSSITDLGGSLKDLQKCRDILQFFMALDDPRYVYWLEGNTAFKNRSLEMVAAPIDVSEMLRQHFFAAKESVILTSATLSVGKSFQYACSQLGLGPDLDSGKCKTVQLPSPFQYRDQALVIIPRDFPKVTAASSLFVDRLIASLRDVAVQTGGRMLVLFTSYKMLKEVYPSLKKQLEAHGIDVLGQGVDSANRSKLVRWFQESGASVLLGTNSFWEGVDIPGDALSCLAMVRLPFHPPNHPVIEAKCEAIKQRSENPFMTYSVPQAVIRFKQGFGRLVRTAKDRGVVIIYDTRVIDTFYGKHFLYSLPGPKIEQMPEQQIVSRIREWMSAGNESQIGL